MCIRFCVNTYFVQVTRSRAVREGRVVDDDLEVAVGTALVLERVLDLRQFFTAAAINEREDLIDRGFLPRRSARVFRVLLRSV